MTTRMDGNPLRSRHPRGLFLVAILLLPACGNGDDATPTPTETPSVPTPTPEISPVPGDYTLEGTVEYEFVPYDVANEGLNYAGSYRKPIRGCEIHLVDAKTDESLATTVTNDDGTYTFAWSGTNYVKLWIYARTVDPVIQVEDNTHDDAVWVIESGTTDARSGDPLDHVARTGWGGDSYHGARASAPFAPLDAAYTAARRILTETENPPVFQDLSINWSPANTSISGDESKGEIGGSHWDGQEIYLVGKEDVDTDEFDTHVTVHEWGHYFEDTLGRSDSLGGVHMLGDILDPRLAWGEGWANGLSGIILDDPIFGMSYGRQQASGVHLDIDANDTTASNHPGWFSETTIMTILYDLYDAGDDEAFDQVALGIDPLYQVLIGPQVDTPAYDTIFSFIAYLKQLNPEQADAIDELVSYHTANWMYGVDPIQDEWGSGETHNGNVEGALPVYQEAAIGDTLTVELLGGLEYNKLGQNRYVKIQGDGSIIRITVYADEEVDIYVQHRGAYIAWSNRSGGNEAADFRSEEGEIYILNVIGYSDVPQTYTATVEVDTTGS